MDRQSLILQYIWKNPGVSRKEIAGAHRLHPNLVSDAVRDLLDAEWIAENGPIPGGTGRSPIALEVHPDKRAALAMSYNLQGITCALVNARGEILDENAAPGGPDTPDALVGTAAQLLHRLIDRYAGHVIGIGVADPGMVDSARGEVVRSSSFPEWRHVPLARLLAEALGLPVLLEDVTQARAMAHYVSLPECQDPGTTMLYLDYSEGVGFALVTPDGAWRGEGFAGELGHVVMEPGGGFCRCGAAGCLESLASAPALEARMRELLAQGITSQLQTQEAPDAEALFTAALAGDRLARGIIDGMMSQLGLAASLLVAAFHPRVLVVGGGSEAALQYLAAALAEALRVRILPEIAATVQVVAGQGSHALAVVGAGLMAFAETIARPEGRDRTEF